MDINIVVVGLGVIGGSYAMALREKGYKNIYAIDLNEDSLRKAESLNIINKGCTEGKKFLKDADIIILSVYPELVKEFINNNKNLFKDGCIITDTTGIKGVIVDDIKKSLPDNVDFVFGHPMAGREKKGIDFATSEVFKGANYIITPIDTNKEKSIKLIEKIALEIGFKKVKRITPQFHDKMVGFTSQLPHAIAVALINSDEEDRDTGSFIGDSYRDLTRIANINAELWCELFLGNKENLLEAINSFEVEMNRIKNAIECEDREKLIRYFNKSSIRREKLE